MEKPTRYIKRISPLEYAKTHAAFTHFLGLCNIYDSGIVIHPRVGDARHDDFGLALGNDIAKNLTNGKFTYNKKIIKICAPHTIGMHPHAEVYFAWWPIIEDLVKIENKPWKTGVIAYREERDINFMAHKYKLINV